VSAPGRIDGLTFERWYGLGPGVPGDRLWRLLGYAPDAERECWANLGWQVREETERRRRDPLLYAEPESPRQRHQPVRRSTAATSGRAGSVALASDDPLKNIEPREYVEALCGVVVPANGWLSCPLPDHEDRTPSFQVLSSHWRCFGCGRGGSVIDLAAALYGGVPRGARFWELRDLIIDAMEGAVYLKEDMT
jgi:hypothetical protein